MSNDPELLAAVQAGEDAARQLAEREMQSIADREARRERWQREMVEAAPGHSAQAIEARHEADHRFTAAAGQGDLQAAFAAWVDSRRAWHLERLIHDRQHQHAVKLGETPLPIRSRWREPDFLERLEELADRGAQAWAGDQADELLGTAADAMDGQ